MRKVKDDIELKAAPESMKRISERRKHGKRIL